MTRIFLTEYATACTEQTTLVDNLKYPQYCHMLPDVYKGVKGGFRYVPHKIADEVLKPATMSYCVNHPAKTAFILASGNAHFAGINPRTINDNELTYQYRFMPLTLTQVFAGKVAPLFGKVDLIMTDASACASSLHVLTKVRELVHMYGFERVIVLGVEDAVSNSVLDFFGEAGASLQLKQYEQGIRPSAFDSVNHSFHIGQGAVFALFETEEFADTPKAELLGAYSASEDSTDVLGQREDGQGFVKAIRGALEIAEVPHYTDFIVKTHGTGTQSNNMAERNALYEVFKDRFIATSYKARIGHTMGASGLLETCLLLDSIIKENKVPCILNRTETDRTYLSEDAKPNSRYIVSSAAGMGNIYSSAIFDWAL